MKKTLWIVILSLVALGALGVSIAFAQGRQPPVAGPGGYGWMHDYVEQALAAKLGLTETQVEEQLAAGKPMYQIALDNGITQENLASFMNDVHSEALGKAVENGVITRERADWMLQRMQNMYQNGYGTGNCPMHNGQDGLFNRGRGVGPGMMGGRGPGMMWGQGYQAP